MAALRELLTKQINRNISRKAAKNAKKEKTEKVLSENVGTLKI